MSGFDPSWLALREAYDHAVRDAGLTAAFVKALGPSPDLIDLGCGTGSNLRFLAPHLQASQRWICVDYDPVLLDVLGANKPSGVEVGTVCLDLAKKLDDLAIEPGVGVTAAALLDLTSKSWLDRLAAHCHRHPVLMTLSFDGRMIWDPVDPDDEAMLSAFLEHQRGDKGFGPSLGPDAADHLAQCFQDVGNDVRLAPSDWVFAGADRSIQLALLDGMAGAAAEIDPSLPTLAWKGRRLALIEGERSSLTVGHLDLLSLPT